MAVWTLNANILIIEFFPLLQVLQVLALFLQEAYAVMFLLLEVIGYLAVFAVDPCFGTSLKMEPDFAVANFLTALAGYFSVGTAG